MEISQTFVAFSEYVHFTGKKTKDVQILATQSPPLSSNFEHLKTIVYKL